MFTCTKLGREIELYAFSCIKQVAHSFATLSTIIKSYCFNGNSVILSVLTTRIIIVVHLVILGTQSICKTLCILSLINQNLGICTRNGDSYNFVKNAKCTSMQQNSTVQKNLGMLSCQELLVYVMHLNSLYHVFVI